MKHKKWVCIVGSAILAPVCTVLFVAGVVGFLALIDYLGIKILFLEIVGVLLLSISLSIMTLIVGCALYEHCTKFWGKRDNRNER